MSWFDTHCHLQSFLRKQELDEVLKHAREKGVEKMVAVGTAPKTGQITNNSPKIIGIKSINRLDYTQDMWGKIGSSKYKAWKIIGKTNLHLLPWEKSVSITSVCPKIKKRPKKLSSTKGSLPASAKNSTEFALPSDYSLPGSIP